MDVMYKNVELTIISAAGANADYGLLGAGRRARHPQPQMSIGNHQLVSVTINPAKSLEESAYQTRGWTY
ncbi:HET-domain-containing protein [Apiospora arundinis]